MAESKQKFLAFGDVPIYNFQQACDQELINRVGRLDDEELFVEDQNQLVTALAELWQPVPPIIDFEARSREFVSSSAGEPYLQNRGAQKPKQLIEYRLPVSGDIKLLKVTPSSSQMIEFGRYPTVYADGTTLLFYIPDYGDDSQWVINRAQAMLDCLNANAGQLRAEIGTYNFTVRAKIDRAVSAEKQRREQVREHEEKLRSSLP